MKKIVLTCSVIAVLIIGLVAVAVENFVPAKPEEYNKMIFNAYNAGNWEKMDEISDKVIKFYPDLEFGYFFKGLAQDELGEHEEAVKYYTKTIQMRPDIADSYQNRGLAYLHNKQYDLAIADYKKALELNPNHENAKIQLEYAENAKKGIVVSKRGNVVNYSSINDPFYLISEYKALSAKKRKEFILKSVLKKPETTLPIYYVAAADDIFSADKNKAAFFYVLGSQLTARDAMACTDVSARQVVMGLPMFAPNSAKYFSGLKPNEKAKILQKVLDWDKVNQITPDPKWVCYHGMQVFKEGKVTTVSKEEIEKQKADARDTWVEQINKLNKQ